MKKALIISTNQEVSPCPVLPLGALQLVKECNEMGIPTQFLDLCFEVDCLSIVKNELLVWKPEIVVLSIRNIDNETATNPKFYLQDIKALVDICRSYGEIQIVAGGAAAAVNGRGLFEYLKVDFVVSSKDLFYTKELVRNLWKGTSVENISHVISSHQVSYTKELLHEPILLDWSYILSMCKNEYLTWNANGPAPVGIQTKTGCVFGCIHCQISDVEGRIIKPYPIGYVVDAFHCMEKKNINRCFITDNVFNYPYENAYDLCCALIKGKTQVKWSCYLAPNHFDKELLDVMKRAGCVNVQFGVDTASEKLLKLWHKGCTCEDIIKAGKLCKQHGVNNSFSLIIGGYGETRETLRESLEVLAEAETPFIWGAVGVRVAHGTKLCRKLRSRMVGKEENPFMLRPEFYVSPHIKDSYLQIVDEFRKEHPDILIKITG